MFIVKFTGLVLVVAVCSLIGVLKGQSIKMRYQKLFLFCEGLSAFYEYINQGGYELENVINNSFDKCDFLYKSDGEVFCCDNDLNIRDKEIINDFFKSLGSSGKKAECNRIKLCEITMKKRLNEAEKEKHQKCKVYSTFGVCIGLGIAVILI